MSELLALIEGNMLFIGVQFVGAGLCLLGSMYFPEHFEVSVVPFRGKEKDNES
jgi:hypothetical protein